MLRLLSSITFTQQKTKDYPSRNLSFTTDSVTEVEINSSWDNFTDTAKIVIPKKIYFVDQNGNKYTWDGHNMTGDTAGTALPPILLRGDSVTISLGYEYPGKNGRLQQTMNMEYKGFISSINPRIPVEIECEDAMWLLKQSQVPNKTYTGTVQAMLQDMLNFASANDPRIANAGIKLNIDQTITVKNGVNVSSFITQNETIAEILNRLQKEYKLESYLRTNLNAGGLGAELRCGVLSYYPDNSFFTQQNVVYRFQGNIIEDELEYKRLDDYKMGVLAKSLNKIKQPGNGLRKDGTPKTVTKQLSILITKDAKGNIIQVPQAGYLGDLRTVYYHNIKTVGQLVQLASSRLDKLYYEGFFGNFTSYGLPVCRHGDNILLRNDLLPEFNGTYKCKTIKINFGVNGYRRIAFPDVRIDNLLASRFTNGQYVS